MPKTVTPDQVVDAAKELEQDEFTRQDLARKLGVDKTELKQSFHKARKAGELDKVRDNEQGAGLFRLTGQ